MNKNIYKSIEVLVEYIEVYIEEKITLDILADISNISKFHLIRIFKNITSATIIDYVRSRKLARSLGDLLNTNMKIIDISTQYNFEHEQTYIRSFKKEFGITPAKFRKDNTAVKIVDKINMDFCKQFENGILFKPQFVVKPSFMLVGIKDKIVGDQNMTENAANSRGLDFFFNHRHRIKNAVYPNTYIGLTRLPYRGANFSYYMPSIQVLRFDDIPKGMTTDTIPSHRYAVFRYIGNHSVKEISVFTMLPLYKHIFLSWMPQVNYDSFKEGSFYFEMINADVASENYCEADLYYPLSL